MFIAAQGLSLAVVSGGYSSFRCAGFSLRWLLLLRSTGSRHMGFSCCGSRAQLLRGMWDLRGPGLEPVSPALTGGFLTTAPPGKSRQYSFIVLGSAEFEGESFKSGGRLGLGRCYNVITVLAGTMR